MSSFKLTQSDRERLVKAILKHRFAETGVKLAAQHASLAAKCFDKAFTKAERAQMDALPDGWLPTVRSIRVQFAGKVDSLDFSGFPSYGASFYATSAAPIWRRIPARAQHGVVLALDAGDRLAIMHEQLQQAVSRANDDLKCLMRQVGAVMNQASTSGKLVALWPEVEPFLAGMGKAPAAVPAVPIGALNKMLGLPVSTKDIGA